MEARKLAKGVRRDQEGQEIKELKKRIEELLFDVDCERDLREVISNDLKREILRRERAEQELGNLRGENEQFEKTKADAMRIYEENRKLQEAIAIGERNCLDHIRELCFLKNEFAAMANKLQQAENQLGIAVKVVSDFRQRNNNLEADLRVVSFIKVLLRN